MNTAESSASGSRIISATSTDRTILRDLMIKKSMVYVLLGSSQINIINQTWDEPSLFPLNEHKNIRYFPKSAWIVGQILILVSGIS